ncbi:hypothetical protein D3C80_2214910 [compost metagenome]
MILTIHGIRADFYAAVNLPCCASLTLAGFQHEKHLRPDGGMSGGSDVRTGNLQRARIITGT